MDDMQMIQTGKQQQIQQQQQVQQQTREQRHMHRHLVRLQNWELEADQTMEQRRMAENDRLISEELLRNEDTRKFWKKQSKQIEAAKAAEGRPAQIQKPARKTFKQKCEDKRLDTSAKTSVSLLANHVSVHILDDLKKEKLMHANSMTPEVVEEAVRQDVDLRMLAKFAYGYEKDKNGEPADEYQRSRKEVDERFLADYISKDAQRRKPHLDRILDQVLNTDLTEEMFEPEYMEYHALELHEQIGRMVYFDNVYYDPVNKDYFDALPQFKKDLIECMRKRYALYGQYFADRCGLLGINSEATLPIETTKELVESDRENYESSIAMEKEMLRERLAETRARKRELLQNEFERMYAVEEKDLLRGGEQMKQMVDEQHMKTEKGADMSNLELTGFVTGYSFEELAKYRKMIEDHPEGYQKDPELVDLLYQQLYRAVDSLGDFKLQAMASQGVFDELTVTMPQETEIKRALQTKAEIRLAEASLNSEIIMRQINGMTDALTALLKNEPLSQPAHQAVRELGYYMK